MDDEHSYVPTRYNDRKLIVYQRGIRKHYGSSTSLGSSSAYGNCNFKKLSTIDFHTNWTSGGSRDQDWTSTILTIAPSVVSVAIFLGVQRKVDCTGLIIHWDELTSKATVLASAKLMRIPEDENRDSYYIVVRLPNGNILLAEEDYVDHCRNIITLKVSSDFEIKTANLSSTMIEEGTEVVVVTRNFYTCSLSESRGKIYSDSPYFGCDQLFSSTCSGSQDGEGGPSITRMGQVCGINFFDGHSRFHPLPIVVVRSCLWKWKFHRVDVQPWFGLTVIDISKLPINTLETLAAMGLNVAVGAIVKQVYEGSPADEVGVVPGDLVVGVEREKSMINIFSASEYYTQLKRMSDSLSDLTDLTDRGFQAHHVPTKNFAVKLQETTSGNIKVVWSKNLMVNDRRFCCSWPQDGYDLFRNPNPLLGSQTESGFDRF